MAPSGHMMSMQPWLPGLSWGSREGKGRFVQGLGLEVKFMLLVLKYTCAHFALL